MEVSDVWIEVRRRTGRTPVTVIELLTPTNKSGDGFVEYKLKRRSLIRQKINVVELDLLLGGRRLPMSLPLPVGDYFAFVSRAHHRPNSEVSDLLICNPVRLQGVRVIRQWRRRLGVFLV